MASKGKSETGKRPKAVKTTASKAALDDAGVYINILTDFGFKRIFGTFRFQAYFRNRRK